MSLWMLPTSEGDERWICLARTAHVCTPYSRYVPRETGRPDAEVTGRQPPAPNLATPPSQIKPYLLCRGECHAILLGPGLGELAVSCSRQADSLPFTVFWGRCAHARGFSGSVRTAVEAVPVRTWCCARKGVPRETEPHRLAAPPP